jgi:hypothetical protein
MGDKIPKSVLEETNHIQAIARSPFSPDSSSLKYKEQENIFKNTMGYANRKIWII